MRISIRGIAITTGTLILMIVSTITFLEMNNALDRRNDAQKSMKIAEVMHGLYTSILPLSFERSVTQVGLSLDTPLPPAFRAILLDQRKKADDGLAALQAKLRGAQASDGLDKFTADIANAVETIARLRQRADAALDRSSNQRAEDAHTIPANIIAAIDKLKVTARTLKRPAIVDGAMIEALDLATYRAWSIREYGGRERTFLAIAALHRAAIPLEDVNTMASCRDASCKVGKIWSCR
jgi:hypothetical protein